MIILVVRRGVEQSGDHVDTAVLDLCGLRVLLIVDEVLAERLAHELLDLLFLHNW